MATFTDWFLHMPWWGALLIVIFGMAILWTGLSQGNRRLTRVGTAAVIAALILGTVGWVFPTDRQRMEDRTRQIIKATSAHDWVSLRSLLDHDTMLASQSTNLAAGVDEVMAFIQRGAEQGHITQVSIRRLDSSEIDSFVTIDLEASAHIGGDVDQDVDSSWQLEFEKDGSAWRLDKITAISLGSADADDVLKQVWPLR